MKMEGIITPIVTPFNRDRKQSINYQETKKLIDYLILHGVSGIFILGSNGEFHVIEEEEKIQFMKKVVEFVDHRVPVYVGTGSCSTKTTIRLSKAAEDAGADAISVITPYFFKPSDEDLYLYFKEISDNVNIPIVLYNIPKATGYSLSSTIVEKLSDLKNIKGIKDSSGDIKTLMDYAEIANKKGIKLLVGSDSKISDAYKLGASGAIAGTSNVIVDTLVMLDKALRNHDEVMAAKLQKDIEVIRSVLPLGTVPSVIKKAIELAGIANVGPARKPVQELKKEDDEQIQHMLNYYHLGEKKVNE